jgi:hypothetical protein
MMELATGSFIGNATVDRATTGVGFQPDAVIVRNVSMLWGEPCDSDLHDHDHGLQQNPIG